jgi:hypothetical protein
MPGRLARRSKGWRRHRRRGIPTGMLAVAGFLLLLVGVVLADAYYQSARIYGELKVVLPTLRQASVYLAQGQLPPGDPFRKADEG